MPIQSNYKVISYDNFHMYHEEDDFPSDRGVFSTWDEAVSECKKIVDEQLYGWCKYQPGISADELFSMYAGFGEDPVIRAAEKTNKSFSGWDYARERSVAIGDS